MTLLQALFLGLLQGLTEFLPVSSSGHLAIAQHFMPGFEQPGVLFDVMLHVGTMVAVLLYFRREVGNLLVSPFRRDEQARLYRRLLALLAAGSVPTAVIGLTFKDFFEGLFHNLTVVSLMLLVTGTLLFLSERFRRDGRKQDQLTLSDALVVGTVQGMAIVPGISRSGSTIAALLLKGVDGETAARFSFLLALPAVFGAALLSLRDLHAVADGQLPVYLAGTGIAFLAGLASIHLLLGVIRKKRLFTFALYCWAAGSLFFCLSM
ncbi:undecaprenyl-diphosphatase 3 [Desulfuromonas versatilis]|uniref:Undecaprenyl-diphosphatase n=1 Tax=Desulfuromonas versatilis TaxID=2802975 RepID=A0ABM8HV09_9BACT|nr:undecaprenyl-diphosphate phosphatase [Desulfuromonas versatilis]BCR06138.1 undecaprenyl-diphosphatase 3 [Desulfuromonas versatilis]